MQGYITATEAARALGVSLQTVLRRIESGAIHAERAGRRTWLIREEEIAQAPSNDLDRQPLNEGGVNETAGGPAVSGGVVQQASIERRLTRETSRHLDIVRERIMRGRRFDTDSTEILRRARAGDQGVTS